jgi:hypothetical protein
MRRTNEGEETSCRGWRSEVTDVPDYPVNAFEPLPRVCKEWCRL